MARLTLVVHRKVIVTSHLAVSDYLVIEEGCRNRQNFWAFWGFGVWPVNLWRTSAGSETRTASGLRGTLLESDPLVSGELSPLSH